MAEHNNHKETTEQLQKQVDALFTELIRTKTKLTELRKRSTEYVSKATKSYKDSKNAIKKESERADEAEIKLVSVKKQLDAAIEALKKGDKYLSKLDLFLDTLDHKTKNSLARAVQKSLHPDKHPGLAKETNRALGLFFSIVNDILNEKE